MLQLCFALNCWYLDSRTCKIMTGFVPILEEGRGPFGPALAPTIRNFLSSASSARSSHTLTPASGTFVCSIRLIRVTNRGGTTAISTGTCRSTTLRSNSIPKTYLLLLPQTVDAYCDFEDHRTIVYHTFTDFMLFSVDTGQTLEKPKNP